MDYVKGYANQAAAQSQQTTAVNTASRIESDIERVKEMTEITRNTISRIVRHARSLGYFEPPSEGKAEGPAPVITTLADALNDLHRAIGHASGALNVFD